jgi:hypothetical protein
MYKVNMALHNEVILKCILLKRMSIYTNVIVCMCMRPSRRMEDKIVPPPKWIRKGASSRPVNRGTHNLFFFLK